MNDLICPSCGKPNSDKVEICQYCGTALKRSATEPLAPIHPGDMPVKTKTSDLERTLPGWLRDARKASSEAEDAPELNFPSVSTNSAKSSPPEKSNKPESPAKKEPASPFDFLAGLSQVNDEDDETPDWLKSLQGSIPNAEAPLQDKSTQPQDLPEPKSESQPGPISQPDSDWGFGGEPDTFKFDDGPEPAQPAAEDAPDWLSALKSQDQSAQPTPPSKSPVSDSAPAASMSEMGDLPDWLSALTGGTSSQPTPASSKSQPAASDDTPDWLAGLGGDFISEENSTPAETGPAAQPPDWLARMDEPSSASVQPAPVSDSAPDLPDWLGGLSTAAQPSAQPAPESPAGPADNELFDWFNTAQDTSPGAAALPAYAEDTPDWMKELQAPVPVSAAQPETPAPAVTSPPLDAGSTPDLPSWLSDVMGEKPAPVGPAVPRNAFDTGSLGEMLSAGATEKTPEWMAGISTRPEPASQAEIVTPVPADTASVEPLPPATQDVSPLAAVTDEQSIDSIFSMEMPDWLAGFTPSDVDKRVPQGDESSQDVSLHPADLPSWVQAMRPMESVMADADESEDDQKVENQGPLSGLRSVLPVQSGTADVYKSSPYALKLLATETQLAQSALLDNLLNSESTPQKAPRRVDTLNIRPLRWLIAILLLLAVLIPAVLKLQIFPVSQPSVDPSPVGAFLSVVNGLSPSAPVLVVVDYQPGFAGELETAAGPVIAQLAEKNIPMAFISTSPVGPFMTGRLLEKYAGAYQLKTQYVDFGYLPGGAGGIKAFAEQPASTVGQDIQLGNMWTEPALAGATVNSVASLANFGAVIVLTDNPDTGRLWIEQAYPSLKTRPLLMVVSAQAEPMIRPYILSGQVSGMVAGLEGATLYESQMGNAGQNGPRTYWDSFGVAMLAAELLILIGGVWGLITGLRVRRTAIEQDEA